jgi:hypothetical protein
MDIPESTGTADSAFHTITEKNADIQVQFTDMNTKKEVLSNLYKKLLDENSTIVNTFDVFNFQIKLFGNDIVYVTSKYKQTNN